MKLFYSYAHQDEPLREWLEAHFTMLCRDMSIEDWHSREIDASQSWRGQIADAVESADVILVLVSPDLLASDYCSDVELLRALERHHERAARVIPIILRPCDWQGSPLGALQALPRGGLAVTNWPDPEQAWTAIAKYLRAVAHARVTFINSIEMPFVTIPTGCFEMGSPHHDREALDWERPQHSVTLTKPLRLGVYSVTQHEFEQVLGIRPSYFRSDPACPVERVSWFDAIEFCNRLSELEARPPYYQRLANDVTVVGGPGYRLPTEAEWEYACRAGATTKYCFGDDAASLKAFAWHDVNSVRKTHPVGARNPNAWGLCDMHGNVWEWCQDWWSDDYGFGDAAVDPTGPATGSSKVFRGGSWDLAAKFCRSAARYWCEPTNADYFLGFRIAMNAPSGP